MNGYAGCLSSKPWVLLVIGALLGGLLSACGTTGRSYVETRMVETLDVEIRPNTSKMFTYKLIWPEGEIPSNVRLAREGGFAGEPKRGGVDVSRGTYERLQENAAYVVAQSGYCREGFFELDRRISRYQLWIRGECKEAATAEDQQRFGTQQSLTAADWKASK